MAKKTTKKDIMENVEITNNNVLNEKELKTELYQRPVDKVNPNFLQAENNNDYMEVGSSCKTLQNISVTELISLEKACRDICNKYESGARLYFSTGEKSFENNNELFNEFRNYHDIIFNELKERVLYFCKK